MANKQVSYWMTLCSSLLLLRFARTCASNTFSGACPLILIQKEPLGGRVSVNTLVAAVQGQATPVFSVEILKQKGQAFTSPSPIP